MIKQRPTETNFGGGEAETETGKSETARDKEVCARDSKLSCPCPGGQLHLPVDQELESEATSSIDSVCSKAPGSTCAYWDHTRGNPRCAT